MGLKGPTAVKLRHGRDTCDDTVVLLVLLRSLVFIKITAKLQLWAVIRSVIRSSAVVIGMR